MQLASEEGEDAALKLVEDEHTGALRLITRAGAKGARGKRQRDEGIESSAAIRRGVIRFLVIIIDASVAMNSRDMRPTRLGVVTSVVSKLLNDFFDQNPISQVALVLLNDGRAERITDLSGNARNHKSRLEERLAQGTTGGKGAASMRYGLEEALRLLEVQASYGTREVLVIYGALNSVDRGDVYETVGKLKAGGIKVNIVGIAAEIFLLQNISDETGGSYKVACTAQNLQTLVLSYTKPAAVLDETPDGKSVLHKPATGMWVGFPRKKQQPLPGWQCPRCCSLHQDLPVDCNLCGLKLLSSSHLARSYHHLFPVPHFDEDEEEDDGASTAEHGESWQCYGCGDTKLKRSAAGRHKCPRCDKTFCELCDGFIHETLHVCPGCDDKGGDKEGADE